MQNEENKTGAGDMDTRPGESEKNEPQTDKASKSAGAEKETRSKKKREESPLSETEKEGLRILSCYPDQEKVFMTSDNFGFFDEHDAREHAKRLGDKNVITVKRK